MTNTIYTDNSRVNAGLIKANAELTEEIELLQDALIGQGKMLSAIVNITKGPPEGSTLHSTHDAVESVQKLNALVWGGDKEAFIKRKQAEAVDDFSFHLFVECQDGSLEDSNAHRKAYSEFFVERLRNEAENAALPLRLYVD